MFGKKEAKSPVQTLGTRIAAGRAAKNMKQNDLAEHLGVSAQAVSKWENDISAPDISMLPALARELDMSVDELLTGEKKEPEVQLLPAEKRNIDKLVLRVYVDSAEGDRVRVNLPMMLVKMAIETGMSLPDVVNNEHLRGIDPAKIIAMVEQGLVGKLVEIESADGDRVEIVVE
jgi:transcriptional regulator with XRE-family HTH domain